MKILSSLFCALSLVLTLLSATSAETIKIPDYRPNSRWIERITIDRGGSPWPEIFNETIVENVHENGLIVAIREPGSNSPFRRIRVPLDLSRTESINGIDLVISRPLRFPLTSGSTWEVSFVDRNPYVERTVIWTKQYVVVGIEDIKTSAGTFTAFKIEMNGARTVPTEKTLGDLSGDNERHRPKLDPTQTSARLFAEYWYAPAAQRLVKSVEETYDFNGLRTDKITTELMAFKLAD